MSPCTPTCYQYGRLTYQCFAMLPNNMRSVRAGSQRTRARPGNECPAHLREIRSLLMCSGRACCSRNPPHTDANTRFCMATKVSVQPVSPRKKLSRTVEGVRRKPNHKSMFRAHAQNMKEGPPTTRSSRHRRVVVHHTRIPVGVGWLTL